MHRETWGVIMVVKKTTKAVPAKKPIQPKIVAQKARVPVSSAEKKDLQVIVDLQAKQLQKLEAMFTTLDADVKDIKKIVSQQVVKTETEPVAKVAPKTAIPVKKPVKAPVKKVAKAVSKPASFQTTVKAPVKAKKPVKPVKIPAPSTAKKVESMSFSDDLIAIPNDIPDRINALTTKKKVTQTNLGKEVDLSQKVIHEIATRKMKDLNKDKIKKITLALKKYESQ